MKRANRIVLITGLLVLATTGATVGADASIFGRKKAAKPVAASTAAVAISLTAMEVDGNRLVLRTNGSPAYTSYSPAAGVFVVDLTGTTRAQSLVIPAELPAGIASLSAEDVVEMGNTLTRVTVRFAEALGAPEAAASGNTVMLTMPAAASNAPATVATVAETTVPTPIATVVEEIIQEPIAAQPLPEITGVDLPKAKKLERLEVDGSGETLAVRLFGDGAIEHTSFVLENPSRLVIDLTGVRNKVARRNLMVGGGAVKSVRIGQFKESPPVTRVVIDLQKKVDYAVVADGSALRVTFGDPPVMAPPAVEAASGATKVLSREASVIAASPVAVEPQKKAASKPMTQTAAATPDAAPIPEKSTWRLPETTTEAKPVIRGPADQAPPTPPARRTTATPLSPTTPENVFNELAITSEQPRTMPVLTTPGSKTLSASGRVFTGEPISLNLKDADIKDVLRTFAQLTGLNMAVDPQVSGSVTVDFVDVPWDQALDIILKQNGLTYTIEGNVMRVGTIARLAAETVATRNLQEQERLNVPLQTVSFKLSYARAGEVQGLLRELASPRARIIVDTRTNQLIISEIPQYLQTMRNLIDSIDIPTRQVVIEARIVEASKTFLQQWGVVWGFRGALDSAVGTGTGLIFPNRVGFNAGPFSFGPGNPVISLTLSDVLGTFNLDLALNATESEGLAKVISAPKIMTQDNTAAEIQSGFQIPYQTRVNFTTTIQYLDATLRLSVTPQITEAGTVIMQIALQKNEPVSGLAIEGAAGSPLSTRTARTQLMVRDGGTAVIGGIYQVRDNNSQTRLPILHKIPVLGHLFKTHNINSSYDELLIFITPRIVRGA